MSRWAVFALSIALLAGCDSDDAPPPDDVPSQGGGGGAGPSHCFNPNDPAVHYQSQDRQYCDQIVLMCEEGQFGFDNACGCGCIDKGALSCDAPTDPAIHWISHDPTQCTPEPPTCPLGQVGFSNGCGCGCIEH